MLKKEIPIFLVNQREKNKMVSARLVQTSFHKSRFDFEMVMLLDQLIFYYFVKFSC